jgi:integrase
MGMPNIFNPVEPKKVYYEPIAFPYPLLDPLLEAINKKNGQAKDKYNDKWVRNHYYDFLRDAFIVASQTGMRRDELSNLQFANILVEKDGRMCMKIENIKVNNIEGRTTPNLRYTYVPISRRLLQFLEERDYKNKIESEDYIIAPQVKDREMLANIFTKSFSHFIQQIPHEENLTFKSFRKSFITAVAMKFSKAIDVTGHSNIKTIQNHYIDRKQVALGIFGQPLYREEEKELEVEEIREMKNQKKDKQIER